MRRSIEAAPPVLSRKKAAAAHGSAAAHHPQSKGNASHPPRHVAPAEVSDVLMSLEKNLVDIGNPYGHNASGRSSAWGSHALEHHAHAPGATHLIFETFYHPFVCEFMKSVTRLGMDGLLTEANQRLTAERDYF